MSTKLPPDEAPTIDAASSRLIEEFRAHVRECDGRLFADLPRPLDEIRLFEAWAIQKIASLQVVVLQLTERLNHLSEQVNRRPT